MRTRESCGRANLPQASVSFSRSVRTTEGRLGQSRSRLPLKAVWGVARLAASQLNGADAGRWYGHRTLMMDGTGSSTPDTPQLQTYFGQPGKQKPGCGFPVAYLLVLFDAATGTDAGLYDLIVVPIRKSRCEPRVIKRRIDKYPRMTRSRDELRESLKHSLGRLNCAAFGSDELDV